MQYLWTICVYLPIVLAHFHPPIVELRQGVLKGRYLLTHNERTFYAFTGIPYAEPPVGKLRFKEPRPAKAWKGILDDSNSYKICPQIYPQEATVKGEEDCLYLNVYTPQLRSYDKKLLPVMVFIHGGAFVFGDGTLNTYDPKNLMEKDIVLVTPNYRLGPLGFLSTGDHVVPGNNGLKDQSLALRWVKANINKFSGDPNKITVFGQSAGGTSAHYHMLSPLSRDLIKGVISESGTAISLWGLAPNDQGLRHSIKLAEYCNCPTEFNSEMVECLRSVNVSEITQKQDLLYKWHSDPITPFKPVIESNIKGAFLPEHPVDIIKSGKAAKVPLIIGITSEDGAMKSPGIFNNSQILNEFNNDFLEIAPITFGYYETTPNETLVSKKIRTFYYGNDEINNSSKPAVTDMYTDGMFLLPLNQIVKLHIKYTNQHVYHYVFGYRGGVSYSEILGDSTYNYGVCHVDELIYLFSPNPPFSNYRPSETDKKITEILTTLWTNFAETGNPTPSTNQNVTTRWNPVQSKNLEYYLINNNTKTEMRKRLYWKRAEFWEKLPLNSDTQL